MPVSYVLPKSWPKEVRYLTEPCYSSLVTPSQLQLPRAEVDDHLVFGKSAHSKVYVKISAIDELAHPANGQCGLFATQNLKPSTFICFYLGFVHCAADTDPESNYDLSLDRDLQIGVDATHMGNEARYINDYRGVTTDGPNAEFRDCFVEIKSGVVEKRLGVFVLSAGKVGGKRAKGIAKGEEILVSYGKGFWIHRRESMQQASP